MSRYVRIINGAEIDIYDILDAYEVTCPAAQHAIKKMMMPGQRGGKGVITDLEEARQAVVRSIQLQVKREGIPAQHSHSPGHTPTMG